MNRIIGRRDFLAYTAVALMALGTGCGGGGGTKPAPPLSDDEDNADPPAFAAGALAPFRLDSLPNAPEEAESGKAAFDKTKQSWIVADDANAYRATGNSQIIFRYVDGKKYKFAVTPVESRNGVASVRIAYRIEAGGSWVMYVLSRREMRALSLNPASRAVELESDTTRGWLTKWWKRFWPKIKDAVAKRLKSLAKELGEKLEKIAQQYLDAAEKFLKGYLDKLLSAIGDDAAAQTVTDSVQSAAPPATKLFNVLQPQIERDERAAKAFIQAVREQKKY